MCASCCLTWPVMNHVMRDSIGPVITKDKFLIILRYALLVPLAVFVFLSANGIVYMVNGLAASSWSETDATVIRTGSSIEYEFEADGRRIVRSTIRHSFVSQSAETLAKRYPVGSSVKVRHSESDGTILSVVEHGLHWDAVWITLVSMLLATICWRGFQPATKTQGANKTLATK